MSRLKTWCLLNSGWVSVSVEIGNNLHFLSNMTFWLIVQRITGLLNHQRGLLAFSHRKTRIIGINWWQITNSVQRVCHLRTLDFAFGNGRPPVASPFTFSTGCCLISSGVQRPRYIHGSFCQVQMPSPNCKYGLSKSCPVLRAIVDSSVHAFTLISLLSLHV